MQLKEPNKQLRKNRKKQKYRDAIHRVYQTITLEGVAECVMIRRYFAYRLVSNNFLNAES